LPQETFPHQASSDNDAEVRATETSAAEEPAALIEAAARDAANLALLQAEESPKAKAAAAAEGGTSSSVPDASAIASIVDKMMADLRPRILEEITKKLTGK
jgi:hypothetical protein